MSRDLLLRTRRNTPLPSQQRLASSKRCQHRKGRRKQDNGHADMRQVQDIAGTPTTGIALSRHENEPDARLATSFVAASRRRLLLSMLLIPAAWRAKAMTTWSLVTPDEAARDLAAPHKAPVRGLTVPGGPAIEVIHPNTEAGLPRPFSVRLQFVPAPETRIVTSSFKATYGWLGLDITQRLLEHAALTADGLTADDINAPAGQHRVTLSIADTQDRVGTRTFRFTIV